MTRSVLLILFIPLIPALLSGWLYDKAPASSPHTLAEGEVAIEEVR